LADDEIDQFLAQALCGGSVWPQGADPRRVVARAVYHGISGSLAGRLDGWPPEAAEAMGLQAKSQAMWEMRHQQILAQLLDTLDRVGLRVLVLKGSALAYDLYAQPNLRARGDTDLLIERADLQEARRLLAEQGFTRASDGMGENEFARLEETWFTRSSDGLRHDIDLHWSAFNSASLSRAIAFEDAFSRARSLLRLSPVARGLPLDLALLYACAHKAMHVKETDRLIWTQDIDLLARSLSPGDWTRLVEACAVAGLGPVCVEGLEAAAGRFGTPWPDGALARLESARWGSQATRYLRNQGRIGQMWSDLLATPGTRGRWHYLRVGLFPPAEHMRAKYSNAVRQPLPVLYLRRAAGFLWLQAFRRRG
jgi:hypothetical protein